MPARRILLLLLIALPPCAATTAARAGPFQRIGETFVEWKQRLFSREPGAPEVVDAVPSGPVRLIPGHPQRVVVGPDAPMRAFGDQRSRHRVIELPREFEAVSVRLQVVVRDNPHGRGHVAFRPVLHVLGEDGKEGAAVVVKPLHIDIRPFRRTRLLGCARLENVRRFAIATDPAMIGKSYESEVREALKAPSKYGFHYSTDAVRIKLPWAETGELVIDVPPPGGADGGC